MMIHRLANFGIDVQQCSFIFNILKKTVGAVFRLELESRTLRNHPTLKGVGRLAKIKISYTRDRLPASAVLAPPLQRPRHSSIRSGGLNFLVIFALLSPGLGYAGDAIVTINDPIDTHIHPPGRPFQVSVSVSDPGVKGPIYYQWFNPSDRALSDRRLLAPGQSVTISSPSGNIGHYRLRFTSTHPKIRFPPQDSGFHMDFGFSILPKKKLTERKLDFTSPFGMVHADKSDPYIAGYTKTVTWQSSPGRLAKKIKEARAKGLEEVVMISGKGWDSPNKDKKPISPAELDHIGNKVSAILDELKKQGISDLRILQVGREENRGDMLKKPYFVSNIEAKLARVWKELKKRSLKTRIMISFVGAGPTSLKEEKAILHSGAARYIDIVGQDPYPWKTDFADPETWLKGFLANLHEIMRSNPEGPKKIILSEFGLPVRGNNNPKGFFGYPKKKVYEPGVSPRYQALYLVKSHVLAMSTKHVEKIYVYNYQNRGNDIHFAEHHFGLRSYAVNSKRKRIPGFPLPAYSAYATLVERLGSGVQFKSEKRVGTSGQSFFFTNNAASKMVLSVIVAWANANERVPLNAFRDGLSAADVVEIVDLFGAPSQPSGESVNLTEQPIYLILKSK